MEIRFEYRGTKVTIHYQDDGQLKKVFNEDTKKNMVVQSFQVGEGFELKRNMEYMEMDVCSASYVRIADLNVFIPRLILIPNTL